MNLSSAQSPQLQSQINWNNAQTIQPTKLYDKPPSEQHHIIYKYLQSICIFLLFILALQYITFRGLQKHITDNYQQQRQTINSTALFYLNHLQQINKSTISQYQTTVHDLQSQINQVQQYIHDVHQYVSKYYQQLEEIKQSKMLLQDKIQNVRDCFSLKRIEREESDRLVMVRAIWRFSEMKSGNNQYTNNLLRQNNQRVAAKSGYVTFDITYYNYYKYISNVRLTKLSKTLDNLQTKISHTYNQQQKTTLQQLKKTLILLFILQEHGGVLIQQDIAMVQQLDWLDNIIMDLLKDKDQQPQLIPQVFAFTRSNSNYLQNQREAINATYFIAKLPNISKCLLAAVKHSQYVTDLINQIIKLITQPENTLIQMKEWTVKHQGQLQLIPLQFNKIEYFETAALMVLLHKQRELYQQFGAETSTGRPITSATEYYGLITIDQCFGPSKLQLLFKNNNNNQILQYLSKLDLHQFTLMFGDLLYVHRLPNSKTINQQLVKLKQTPSIINGSYLQSILFTRNSQVILPNQQKPKTNSEAYQWLNLSKIIWIFSDTDNTTILDQLCLDNLKKYSKQSDFQLRVVNQNNINAYLSQSIIDYYDSMFKHHPSSVAIQLKSHLYKLSLLSQYGGIYLDSYIFAVQNFDWIINIAKHPSQLIFNRYGQLPKVFMNFNPNKNNDQWYINTTVNSKVMPHLAYDSSFMAAQKQSKFVKDWLNALIQLINKTQTQVKYSLQKCKIIQRRWNSQGHLHLLALDAMQYVINCKQLQIENGNVNGYADANDYYKIWSMNGYLSLHKFQNNNISSQKQVQRYFMDFSESTVQKIQGKIFHLTKINQNQSKKINQILIKQFQEGTIKNYSNKDSLLTKYLYDHSRHTLKQIPQPDSFPSLFITVQQ